MPVRSIACAAILLIGALTLQPLAAQQTGVPPDNSPHTVRFVSVESNVSLEVLDWGGTGRPIVLLAGLGFDAHSFDDFAPRLAKHFHVYGITRRGYGRSSAPKPDCTNYTADRLGDDVLAVMDSLSLKSPILVGHSIAGEELSSIGTRRPEKVAGLVYLDAAYGYAFYDDSAKEGDPASDVGAVRAELWQLVSTAPPAEKSALMAHLLATSLPRLEHDLGEIQKKFAALPPNAPAPPVPPEAAFAVAIQRGEHVYGGVRCPVLAIFAVPHHFPSGIPPAQLAEMTANDLARVNAQADAFQRANPQATILRIPNADHFVFRSNESDVLQAINAFAAKLP